MLKNAKILVTGPTGQVAGPVARALAPDNDVFGLARFSDARGREALEAAGVRCVAADLGEADFRELPDDFDYVLHFAVVKTNDFEKDLRANVEGTGLLMQHCRSAKAFLHCSSTAVYEADGHHALAEDDALGDNHRVFMPTYSLCKIGAEGVARLGARQWNLPTVIARLNVPYGDAGGWPAMHLEQILQGSPVMVHEDAPSEYNPIHEDDIVRTVPLLLEHAAVPATIVNWGGTEVVSIEDWCAYLGGLVGREPKFNPTVNTLESVKIDTTKMVSLVGGTEVDWRDGMRRLVAARHPEIELRG